MKEFVFDVKDPMGLHARPASLIFMEARKYSCSIEAHYGENKADCKSLLALMSLGAMEGASVLFRFEGVDEEDALLAVKAVLKEL